MGRTNIFVVDYPPVIKHGNGNQWKIHCIYIYMWFSCWKNHSQWMLSKMDHVVWLCTVISESGLSSSREVGQARCYEWWGLMTYFRPPNRPLHLFPTWYMNIHEYVVLWNDFLKNMTCYSVLPCDYSVLTLRVNWLDRGLRNRVHRERSHNLVPRTGNCKSLDFLAGYTYIISYIYIYIRISHILVSISWSISFITI